MWEFLHYAIIFIGLLITVYLSARVTGSAWFSEKIRYHKRLLDEMKKGDETP